MPEVTLRQRIVIVDDQHCFRQAARTLLEARGYDVVAEAADAAQAADAVARVAADGVLLDVHLGAADGFQVSAALTRAHPGLAVVLTSADDHQASALALEASGARGFVRKLDLGAADLSCFWPS
jgi:DNA-binding NarL/FixJ family response regulator